MSRRVARPVAISHPVTLLTAMASIKGSRVASAKGTTATMRRRRRVMSSIDRVHAVTVAIIKMTLNIITGVTIQIRREPNLDKGTLSIILILNYFKQVHFDGAVTK